MPYPLENLQYGLRRRLRELATRSEAYALQIAAPNYSGFRPIQKARSLAQAVFVIRQENYLDKILYPQQPKNSHEIPLYIVSNKLTFCDFTPGFKLNTILDDFLFAPNYVQFYNCCLDEMFMQSFVNVVNNPIQCITFWPSSFTSENAAKMLSTSPAIKTLEVFAVVEPLLSVAWWIQEFVKAKCTSFKEFNVHNAPLSVFEIDKNVFLQFIKAQRETFILHLRMDFDIEWHSTIEERLNNLFDEHFERCRYSPEKKGVYILFNEDHLRRFYVLRDGQDAQYDLWQWSTVDGPIDYIGYPEFSETPQNEDTSRYIQLDDGVWSLHADDGYTDSRPYICQRKACDAENYCDIDE